MTDAEGSREAIESILEFWFADALEGPHLCAARAKLWFGVHRDFDERVASRFSAAATAAAAGGLSRWCRTAEGMLALILALDQFPRNIHRGTASAFAGDARALRVCREGMASGLAAGLHPVQQAFFHLPLEHAEDLHAQNESVHVFSRLLQAAPGAWRTQFESFCRYAVAHRDLIERFGRFPHRNAILGRPSTPEEEEFLARGGQTFGQR